MNVSKVKEDVRCFEVVLMLPAAVVLGPRERKPRNTVSRVSTTTANPSGANFGRLARGAVLWAGGNKTVRRKGRLCERGGKG